MKPIIYMLKGCPYCDKVERFVQENKIDVEYKVTNNPEIKDELRERSGRTQVPYLVDESKSIEMPESDDIIEYLEKNYVG